MPENQKSHNQKNLGKGYIGKLLGKSHPTNHDLAMLKFDNINLALVTKDEHPNHFAIVDRSIVNEKNIQYHRDGIGYIYETDPNGNFIELLDQES